MRCAQLLSKQRGWFQPLQQTGCVTAAAAISAIGNLGAAGAFAKHMPSAALPSFTAACVIAVAADRGVVPSGSGDEGPSGALHSSVQVLSNQHTAGQGHPGKLTGRTAAAARHCAVAGEAVDGSAVQVGSEVAAREVNQAADTAAAGAGCKAVAV